MSEEIGAAIAPPRVIDGDLANDGWRRFEACVLYSNALFRARFKVFTSGTVEMESDEPMADELPLRMRRYDGIFRTPPADPADD